MLIYVLAAVAGLLFGMVTTRRVTPLLLTRVKGLYLLLPVVLAAVAPIWLNATSPERIWTDDRQLLIILIMIQQGAILLILVMNLLPSHLPMPLAARVFFRRLRNALAAFFNRIMGQSRPSQNTRRVVHEHRPAMRWWHRLPMLVVLAAALMQTYVLVNNNGYMPLTRDYLDGITNPAIIAGIENGALLMKRLVDSETILPQLAQSIRLPLLEDLFPTAFPYYGPAQLLGAAGLFITAISQFFDRVPGRRS